MEEIKEKIKDEELVLFESITEPVENQQVKIADGGLWAWIVCFSTIITFGFYAGFDFNYGLIYTKMIYKNIIALKTMWFLQVSLGFIKALTPSLPKNGANFS
jgi:hypothetical protein